MDYRFASIGMLLVLTGRFCDRYRYQCTPIKRVGLGVGRHMLNDAGLAAFDMGNAVLIVFRAGVDTHSFIYGSGQIGLGGLTRQIGARDLDLKTGLVWR